MLRTLKSSDGNKLMIHVFSSTALYYGNTYMLVLHDNNLSYCMPDIDLFYIYICVTLRGRIKEAARTLRKQDPALPENRALNRCEVCFNWV